MIFRAKLTSCRSFLFLFTIGLVFLTVNIVLVWNQQQNSPQNICVCEPSINMPPPAGKERPSQDLDAPLSISVVEEQTSPPSTAVSTQDTSKEHSHQLAVIVPFRDRYEEMIQFVPHIHQFLNRQNVRHKILVINQADKHR